MALFNSTAFSKLEKSFGNLTACRSRRQNIVKEKISDMFNPRTVAQQMQRLRMKTLIELCGVYDPVIAVGFPRRPVNYTCDNQFVQLNQQAVTVTEDLKVSVDYEGIMVAKGKQILPEVTVSLVKAEHQLIFTHEADVYTRHGAGDDQFYAAVLEQKLQRLKLFPLNDREDKEPVTVTLPTAWDMEGIVAYVFVLTKNGKTASLSRCIKPV